MGSIIEGEGVGAFDGRQKLYDGSMGGMGRWILGRGLQKQIKDDLSVIAGDGPALDTPRFTIPAQDGAGWAMVQGLADNGGASQCKYS